MTAKSLMPSLSFRVLERKLHNDFSLSVMAVVYERVLEDRLAERRHLCMFS